MWDMVSKVWRRGAGDLGFGHAPSKVTFGIWVVTHSSAGERLGYMRLWKCTSCMIILYSRLNGVHPILYLVNMSHLICVCVCLSCVSPMWATHENTVWPSECGLSAVCPRPRSCHMSAGCVSVYVKVHPLLPLAHLGLLCQSSHDHREHLMFLCVASDSSKSQMTERHGGNKSMKH